MIETTIEDSSRNDFLNPNKTIYHENVMYIIIELKLLLTKTFGEIIKSFSTLVTEFSSIVRLARTLPSRCLTMRINCSVGMTVTRLAIGVIIVTKTTAVTIWWLKFFPTLTLTRALSAVPRCVKVATLASCGKKGDKSFNSLETYRIHNV